MDIDSPEIEILNLEETATIVAMHFRLLNRRCAAAAESIREFSDIARSIPMDDWDDDCIAD